MGLNSRRRGHSKFAARPQTASDVSDQCQCTAADRGRTELRVAALLVDDAGEDVAGAGVVLVARTGRGVQREGVRVRAEVRAVAVGIEEAPGRG